MTDEDNIPEFLKITSEQRKAVWETNPPKPSTAKTWRTPEQEEFEKARLQSISDQKRMQRCLSKQKRIHRQQAVIIKLEDRKAAAEGKQWDVRTARWIDPIEEALKPSTERKRKMTAKKTKEPEEGNSGFGFHKDTNYDRMMKCLMANLNTYVPVETLAKKAYDTDQNLEKHCRRVVAMARKVQDKVITKKHLAYTIQKEKKENALSIGLFAK